MAEEVEAKKGRAGARRRAPRAPKDRAGVENVEGLPQSFRWETRLTKEEQEIQTIIGVLDAHPGKEAHVKQFRTATAAESFAEKLRQAKSSLEVHVRELHVFAKAEARPGDV